MASKYIIGIDLGTTNCTLAYCSAEEENPQINQFAIPQLTNAAVQEEEYSLPSFIYFPLEEELATQQFSLSWDQGRKFCLGKLARDRGAQVPARLISSAKSWLCNAGIDRREKILPLGDGDELEKMSPTEACSELLRHLREAWELKMPKDPFEKQYILITVPASFDPSARQMVLEAAEKAGYPEVILLEEPQAAFYSWLEKHQKDWRKLLKVGDHILVVDIGGGTTDFSLIAVEDSEGDLALNRVAVGSHLLLGGDNIDLSLAYLAKEKLENEGHAIDEWQLQSLIHSCREAKEQFLGEKSPPSIDIAIMGRGRKLIKGTLKTTLTKQEAEQFILQGFMPLISPEERSPTEKRTGIQQLGLPYAQDARISCQLAKFLSMTGESENGQMDKFILPSAILFNGGTMKAAGIRSRLVELLNAWAKTLGKEPVKVLPEPSYEFAVSRGAAYYGLARQGKGIRIKSGTSRSYFIGVEDSAPAVPGFTTPLKAVCVVPFGMEEGTEMELSTQEFALLLGEQATFRFFSHATATLQNGIEPVMGTVVKSWKQELTELHPIETRLEKAEGDGKTVRVKLSSRVTELGVLELWCAGPDGRKWKLEFDIRVENPLSIVNH